MSDEEGPYSGLIEGGRLLCVIVFVILIVVMLLGGAETSCVQHIFS